MQIEEQYKHVERIASPDGTVLVHDIAPEDLSEATPIVFIPGWGASGAAVSDFVYALAQEGRRVLIADYEHLDRCTSVPDEKYEHVPCLEYAKAIAVKALLEKRHILHADIVSHSEGSVAASVVADMLEGRVRTLVLMNPAGLLKRDSLVSLLTRFTAAMSYQLFIEWGNGLHGRSVRLWSHVLWYVLTNPIQTFREAFALPYCHIAPYIQNALNHKTNVYVLHTKKDHVFPLRRVEKAVRDIPGVRMSALDGNHIYLYLKPETFAKRVLSLLHY